MVCLSLIIENNREVEVILSCFIYAGLISALFVLIFTDYNQVTRVGSVLANENILGMNISISAFLSIYFFLQKRKPYYLFFFIFMSVMIFLTGSRKALVFLVLSIILYLFLKNRKSIKSHLKFIIVSILIIFLVIYLVKSIPVFYEIIGKRFENLFEYLLGNKVNEKSINERTFMSMVGLNFFFEKPLLGYGIDNFEKLFSYIIGGREVYSHNNFIELMVGVGLIGAILFYGLVVLLIVKLLRMSKTHNPDISYVFISLMLSYIAISVGFVYYDSFQYNYLFAMACTLPKTFKS